MTDKKGFNLADVLSSVSNLDTGKEQITYVDLDLIDGDKNNFYQMGGIENLAANIELVGLQQPVRLRENPDAEGRYILVSGHRRVAACKLLRDAEGGAEKWGSIAAIIERREESAAWRELRLIFANNATRQLTSADIARQAERVQALLYELKKEGVEFQGRMRDHVAEACKVSAAKLARISKIKKSLHADLYPYFDRGEMAEDVAYKMARLPDDVQAAAAELLKTGKRKNLPKGATLDVVLQDIDKRLKAQPCKKTGQPCHNCAGKLMHAIFEQYYWNVCSATQCCETCPSRANCSAACDIAKAGLKAEAKKRQDDEKKRIEKQEKEYEKNKAAVVKRAAELLPFCAAGGMEENDKLFDSYEAPTVKELRAWADGGTKKTFYSTRSVLPIMKSDIIEMAKRLHLTADQVLGLSPLDTPQEEKAMDEQTGNPPRDQEGFYAAKIKCPDGTVQWEILRWEFEKWFLEYSNFENELPVLSWIFLAPVEEPEDDEWDDEEGDDE